MSVVYRNLDGEEISFEEWVLLMEDDATRRIARTVLRNGRIVSTVWLGLAMPGPEAAFETMVFPATGDYEEVDMWRDLQRLAAAHRDASAAADRAADRLTAEGHLAVGTNLADRWRSARAAADHVRDLLADAVRAAAHEGTTEYRIAQACGLTRSTVRDMLGKPR